MIDYLSPYLETVPTTYGSARVVARPDSLLWDIYLDEKFVGSLNGPDVLRCRDLPSLVALVNQCIENTRSVYERLASIEP